MIGQWEIERTELIWALQTRVLSASEMERVKNIGWNLVVRDNVPYYEQDKKTGIQQPLTPPV